MAGPAKRVIYVYRGLGALEENNKVLMSQLLRFVNTQIHSVQFISSEETIEGECRKTVCKSFNFRAYCQQFHEQTANDSLY